MSEARPLPHQYVVRSGGTPSGPLSISSRNVKDLEVAPPAEFGGPGDLWSPETLFVSAIASCFELTFRAIARSSRLEWNELRCEVEAVLDRVDKVVQFTDVLIHARLLIPDAAETDRAKRLVEKLEKTCLITNSILCDTRLDAQIDVA
jgi:organic hydroperoxide reductase OsmC/OhrA